jgi:hypothetical protein
MPSTENFLRLLTLAQVLACAPAHGPAAGAQTTHIADVRKSCEVTRGGISCPKTIFDRSAGRVIRNGSDAKQVRSMYSACSSGPDYAVVDIFCPADKFDDTMATIDSDPYVSESAY